MSPSPRLTPRSPNWHRNPVPSNIVKSNRFDKLIEKFWKQNGSKSGANYHNAWNKARGKAYGFVQYRIMTGKSPIPGFIVVKKVVNPHVKSSVFSKGDNKAKKSFKKIFANRRKMLAKKKK